MITISHERLLQTVVSVLIMAGYKVSERCGMRPRSFDLIARKGDTLVILKIVPHIDSMGEDSAYNLAFIAKHLNAKPFIIGEKARDFELERGAVYLRYGIIATSAKTFYDYFVDDVPPLVYAQPGGLYVNINGNKLRQLREENNMSLGDLAGTLGVSRRTISKYENGMSTTLDIAIKLEEIFDSAVVEAVNLLNQAEIGDLDAYFGKNRKNGAYQQIPADVSGTSCQGRGRGTDAQGNGGSALPHDFERLGMTTHRMQRAPFEALCVYENDKILAGYGPSQKALRRAALIGNISDITDTKAVCVLTDSDKTKKIGKTLVIGESELAKFDEGSDLIELINES